MCKYQKGSEVKNQQRNSKLFGYKQLLWNEFKVHRPEKLKQLILCITMKSHYMYGCDTQGVMVMLIWFQIHKI